MDDSRLSESTMSTVLRVMRIAAPLLGLLLIGSLVLGYIGEYRDMRDRPEETSSEGDTEPTASVDETTSVEPTGVPEVEPTNGAATTGQKVVVLIEGLNMRTAATTDSEVIKRLSLDAQLTLIGQSTGWYQVRDEAGDEGWVAAGGKYTKLE